MRSRPLSPFLILLMATATGLAVASNYYAQPLLNTIAAQFDLTFAEAGWIVTTAQLSYGAGLLLLVPLGDRFEQRGLIVSMTIVSASGLLISAFAPSLTYLLIGTALTGLFSVVAQVLVPFAATLASPDQRGRVVGTVMSGLILGILLARTVAGGLSALGDWRTVYLMAAGAMLASALVLGLSLPRHRQHSTLSYPALIKSVISLFALEPVLRHRALLGAISFVLFSLFWTPSAFLLGAPPYDYPDAIIGLFGLAGAAGALAASWAGRLSDRGQGELGTRIGVFVMLFSWLPLGLAPYSLGALIFGVIVLDLAAQLVHVGNQNAIYQLRPEARNRLNAGYMTCYFMGGAIGSLASTQLYQRYGWTGIIIAGTVVALAGVLVGLHGMRAAPLAKRGIQDHH